MSEPFTVIGYWDGSRPVSVGVIAGVHDVHAGEGATEEGDWAMAVEAESPEAAEVLAIRDMRLTDQTEGFDDDEEADPDTDEEGAQL